MPEKKKKRTAPRKKTVQKEAQKSTGIIVGVNEESVMGKYCNETVINHNANEFVFNYLWANEGNMILVAQLVTNPGHAKRLLKALEKNIAVYEKKFGEIKV